jgi:DNA-binding NarL/FixJ family response regulator
MVHGWFRIECGRWQQESVNLRSGAGFCGMARQIKVLIAEDHDVVREGLKILIGADPGIQVAGEANNGARVVALASKLQPDVVLMDLAMPGTNGVEATKAICRTTPESRVLVLSAYQDEEIVESVIAAGVSGYITKHSAAEELLTAIHEVGSGRAYYSPAIAGRLRARRRASFESQHAQGGSGQLTPRERQVLALIASGQPNKQIADTLGLSIKTVEKHRQAAMDKLNLHDTASLTRYALSNGMLDVRPRVAGD